MEGDSQGQASSQITPRLEVKIENLEHQVSDIKVTLEKVAEVMIAVAEERVRVDNIEKTVTDLNQRTRSIESYKWVLIIGGIIFTGVLTGFASKFSDLADLAKKQPPTMTEERLVELVSKTTIETIKKQQDK